MRLPIEVMQESNVANRVGAGAPRKVSVISRLRRVTASSVRYSSPVSTAMDCTCNSSRPWVAWA